MERTRSPHDYSVTLPSCSPTWYTYIYGRVVVWMVCCGQFSELEYRCRSKVSIGVADVMSTNRKEILQY